MTMTDDLNDFDIGTPRVPSRRGARTATRFADAPTEPVMVRAGRDFGGYDIPAPPWFNQLSDEARRLLDG